MIYFDNNATTRVADEAVDAMLPFLTEHYGNPSAGYKFAKECKAAVRRAREQIALFIGAEPEEIVFTGCGTESNNAAVFSALAMQPGKRHIITTAVEHSAILKYLARQEECEVTILPVDRDGRFSLSDLESAIRDDTALVTAMLANNETGVISPVFEAAKKLASRGILFHTDAVNAAGKTPVRVSGSGIHMLSLSGHKFHAPKGIGALYVNRNIRFQPLLIGGGQEDGRRSGTEAVPNIVSMGRAAVMATAFLDAGGESDLAAMRDRFEEKITGALDGVHRNGSRDHRLANTAHLSFDGLDAGEMLILLDEKGVCCSSGSACSTGESKPSHVMVAMGHTEARAKSSLRFSFSRYNTMDEIERGADIVIACAKKLHSLKPGGSGPVILSA